MTISPTEEEVKSASEATAPATTTTTSGTTKGKIGFDHGNDTQGQCLKCNSGPAIYECDPCGHASFCTTCARKMATGGRCKVCGEFYGGLRRVVA